MKLKLRKNLDGTKDLKIAQIDAEASRKIERYRSAGMFADRIYAQKRDELRRFEADPDDIGVIAQAEADARGISPIELFMIWSRKISREDEIMADIEAKRQRAKIEIRNADTTAKIEAITSDFMEA